MVLGKSTPSAPAWRLQVGGYRIKGTCVCPDTGAFVTSVRGPAAGRCRGPWRWESGGRLNERHSWWWRPGDRICTHTSLPSSLPAEPCQGRKHREVGVMELSAAPTSLFSSVKWMTFLMN